MTEIAAGKWALSLLVPFYVLAPPLLILKSASKYRTEEKRKEAERQKGLESVNLSLVTPFQPTCVARAYASFC